MKIMMTPNDCIKYSILKVGDGSKKELKARAVSIRFRLKKLWQGKRATAKLVSAFDRAIEANNDRLEDLTTVRDEKND